MTDDPNVIDITSLTPTRKKGGRPKGSKTQASKLKAPKRANAITNKQIAEIVIGTHKQLPNNVIANVAGVHPNTVRNIQADFRQLFDNLEEVESFRSVRADILDAIDLTLLKSMLDPSKHEKATLAQLAFAHSKLYESSRLERNLSTANVSQTVRFTEVNLSPISSLPSSKATLEE